MSRPGGVVVRAWARPLDAAEKPPKGERRKKKPPPFQPQQAGRCPRCGAEKSWLRLGEVCAPCRAPVGAPPRLVLEDDEEPAPVIRLREDVMREKREWIEGLSSEALAAWRQEHGVSRRAVGDHLGVSEQAIGHYESGKNVPTEERQQQLLELLKGPPPFQPRLQGGAKPGKPRPRVKDREVKPANEIVDRDTKPENAIAESDARPQNTPEADVAEGSHDPRAEAIAVPTTGPGLRQAALAGVALLAKAAAGGLAALARRAEELSR